MREKILTVEDHFLITGRGLVVVGKFNKNSPVVKIGDSLIIITSESREIETRLAGIEIHRPQNFEKLAILLPELSKDEVPIGSDIFVET